jgi:uncharacterized protein (DUF927 family)
MSAPLTDWSAIPARLKQQRQFLLWKLEEKPGDKKPRKVPHYASGRRRTGTQGSEADRAALVDFETARAAISNKAGYAGIGFAFLPGDGLIGIDLDHMRDAETGALSDRAKAIMEACDSYTEISPSGTGLHIYCTGHTETFKSNDAGVEVFCERQFFTLTGQYLEGTPREVKDITPETLRRLKATVEGARNGGKARTTPAPQAVEGQAKVESALAYVSADCGYDDWIKIGMAIHAELGAGAFHVWDAWSAKGGKYPGEKVLRGHWKSFRPGAVTIGTLYGIANESGWKPARESVNRPAPRDPGDVHTSATGQASPARRKRKAATEGDTPPPASDQASPQPGFFIDPDGLWFIGVRPDGSLKPAEWLSAPIKVLYRARFLDGTGWRLLLEIVDRDGEHREITIMDAEIGGQDGIWHRALADAGLKIHPKRRADLAHYLLLECDAAPRAWAVEKTGWHMDCYVMQQRTIGASEQPIIYQGLDRTAAFGESGTAEEWREHVGKPCAGNARLVLAATAGLAATLLPFSGMQDSAGFHYYGNSSTGKTTALAVGASIFGPPAAYISTWRNTGNATEGTAAKHNHGLLCMDEIREAVEKEIGSIVMMLGNGSGKGRMKDTAALRERLTWLLIWLSTGEHAMAHYLEAANLKPDAGMMVRQLDIPADAGRGLGLFANLHGNRDARTFAETLRARCDTYHGAIGVAWLEHVTNHLAELKRDLPGEIVRVTQAITPRGAESQVLRALRRFALLAVAGEYATTWGLTGWQAGEAIAGIKECAAAWLDQRGGAGNLEERRQIERLRDFLGKHSSGRFMAWDRATDDHAPGKDAVVGLRRKVDEEWQFYITPEGWGEIYRGMDPAAAAHALGRLGMLMLDNNGKPYRREYLPGMGQRRCYRPVPTFFQLGENDAA